MPSCRRIYLQRWYQRPLACMFGFHDLRIHPGFADWMQWRYCKRCGAEGNF